MENLLYNISQVLGITIIHSLWQGLLIYFVLRLVFSSIPALSSVKKYNLSAVALLSMAIWFIYTFCAEASAYDWSPATGNYSAFMAGLNLHAVAHPDFKTTLYTSIKSYLPFVSIIYAIGLVVNLGKLGFAWNKIRLIKRSMISADNLQERINEFSRKLNISRYVKVSFSRLVDVPCVIGYFKPILLLPITLTFQLSAEEIETIILHELSHIKGNDYVVNLVQQVISVMLFFNPFAQLINSTMSTERENRCDDMVVEKTGNPLTYAYALLKLEEVRQGELKLALAATQNKHHLLNRIERIMNTKTPIGNIRPIVLAVLLIAGSLGSIAWLNPEVKNGKVTFRKIATTVKVAAPAPPVPSVAAPVVNITAPAKNKVTITCDTTRNSQLNDTTKKKKIKIVVEDENGVKKEYSSVNDMPESVRRDFLKENGDMDFNMNFKMNDSSFNKMNRFYSSPEWKKQMEAMQDNALAMTKRLNTPEYKKQMEAMQKQAMMLAEKANGPEMKKFQEEMKVQAEKMKEYYNSPEWKKQMDEMKVQGEKMKEYYNGPEMKKFQEDMKAQGEKMKEYYNSPEWKKQIEELSKESAEFGTKYINSPEWKKMVDDMAKMGDEMRVKAYLDGDVQERTKPTAKKATTKTAVKEKAEKKEKPEKKETPEKPEKKEKPESDN